MALSNKVSVMQKSSVVGMQRPMPVVSARPTRVTARAAATELNTKNSERIFTEAQELLPGGCVCLGV